MPSPDHIERILQIAKPGGDEARLALARELEQLLNEERRRVERTSVVAMSEEDAVRYRAISELASDFVYAVRVDEVGGVTVEWISGSFERLTGYSQEEVNDQGGWLEFLHPDDRASLQANPGPLSSRRPMTLEYRVITKAGDERWFRDHACPEVDAAGARVIRIFGAVKDVTAEKHAEDALREAMKRLEQRVGFEEARFRSVLDQAGEAIFMIDPHDGGFIDVNETACRMLGYSRAELLEMDIDGIEVEKPAWLTPEQFKELRKRSMATESYHRRRDGTTFPVEIAVSVRRYAGRDYLLAIARETTERKQMEVQLAQADRLASVGVLAAGVAHEVNNPLVYILNNVSYVLSELPPEYEELRAALCEARSGAERVRDIVQDLKTFARSEERIGPIDVRQVLDTSIKLAQNEIRFRATLVRAYDDDVPPVKASDRLGQVFLNLLMNAVHSLPDGGPLNNRIVVTVRHDQGRVAIGIEDSGSGIPADKLGKIFDPFFTTKPVGMGTGLGLSICRNITKSLGGDIEVESGEGMGSKFTVWLPVLVETAGVTEKPSSLPPAIAPRSMRVLVVDDDPFVARAISRLLRAQHTVTLASGGTEALDLIGAQPFDVVFCDVMMPAMTGMELFQEVQRRVPELAERFVFITGGAFTPEARAFLAEADTLCLQKPFSPNDLAAAMEQAAAPREPSYRSNDRLRAANL
jgi:PAS domain S-box-containing protein